jgi:uncharacterized SAM-binding protein YcdF (DUF218 family)
MLFWLKKTIGSWLMPLPLSLTAIAVGFVLLRYTTRRRLGRACIAFAVVVLLIFTNKFVAKSLMRSLETQYPAIPEFVAGTPLPSQIASCRYVVVLGGGNGVTPGLAASNLLSSSSLSRFVEGLRIWRALPNAKLIVTGGGREGEEPNAHYLARAARAFGVPDDRLLIIDRARDTEDESRAVKALVPEGRVALVTSAWHMPRAYALFRGAGLYTTPCPADFATHEDPGFRLEDYTWSFWAIGGSERGLYERLGQLWIKLRGKG